MEHTYICDTSQVDDRTQLLISEDPSVLDAALCAFLPWRCAQQA